jgi:four helix bundle protein
MSEYFKPSDKIKELPAYINSYKLSKIIWEETIKWDNFSKFSIGGQIVRSADSVSANIAEGYGRYFYKEKIKFYYYSRGSLQETIDWLRKSCDRKLISDNKLNEIRILTEKIEKDINILIYNTKQQL